MSLITGFANAANRFPERNALFVRERTYSYAELAARASGIARAIRANRGGSNPLAALLADRSVGSYAGCLGILASGRGYVPLNPKLPRERLSKILLRSGADVIVAGRECLSSLEALLPDFPARLLVVLPDAHDIERLRKAHSGHDFTAAPPGRALSVPDFDPSSTAYLLFTSGSTGEPKGVAVTHANAAAYLDYVSGIYDVSERDRFSQQFDMSFDLSVHDMFLCWSHGACLYSVPAKSLMGPARFIASNELTMWFSVPSVAAFMLRMNMLKPGAFPSLRYSLFCGEPLPAACAEAWQAAAPNSIVENLYGPTEATIAITRYRWHAAVSPSECANGIVPIGRAFDGQRAIIAENGELCLSGSQVTPGYWRDAQKTAEQFVKLPGQGDAVWYRTGDLASQDATGCTQYLGRLDNQVKLRGFRVELQEIDFALRRASETEDATAIAWPVRDGRAEGIVGFVAHAGELDESRVLARCREQLPDYMIPSRIHKLPAIPLNINGKIDRKSLAKLMEG